MFFFAFLPESFETMLHLAGLPARFVFWPSHSTEQWRVSKESLEAYGSGYCSGFTPDSLLNSFAFQQNKWVPYAMQRNEIFGKRKFILYPKSEFMLKSEISVFQKEMTKDKNSRFSLWSLYTIKNVWLLITFRTWHEQSQKDFFRHH